MGSCAACDNELRPVDRFCSQCGIAVLEPAAAATAVPGEPWRRGGPAPWSDAPEDLPGAPNARPPSVQPAPVRVKRSRRGFRTLALVCVLIAGVVGAYAFTRGRSQKPPTHLVAYMTNGGVTYAPTGQRYRVTLPARPRESTAVGSRGSRPTTLHVAVVADPQYQLQVSEESVADAPAHAKVYDYLHTVAARNERDAKVDKVNETRVTHEGAPAIRTVATVSGWELDDTLVYSNGRLYRISVRTQSDGPGVLARVMRSFHVTKTG